MKLLIFFISLQGKFSFEMIGYNCEDTNTNVSTFNAFKVEECVPLNNTKIIQKKGFYANCTRKVIRRN